MILCKSDITLKDYFRNKEHFADFINVVQFHGNQVLSANNLSLIDTDMSSIVDGKHVTVTYDRNRDIMMKSEHERIYVLTAIENQKATDYHMPLRNLVYDALHYNEQLREYSRKDKQIRERFYLKPLHTLTVYYGEPRWSAPRTLSDMMKCPDIYQGIINDWNANIVDIKDIDIQLFQNEDNRDLIKGIQMFYQSNIDKFKPHMKVSKEIAILIMSIVNNDSFLEIINEQEGEKIDMCILTDQIRMAGMKEGEMKGKQEGRKEGLLEGKISLLIKLLKGRFNALPQEIIINIENSNLEQLDSLENHFYKLNKPEDVIEVLNSK